MISTKMITETNIADLADHLNMLLINISKLRNLTRSITNSRLIHVNKGMKVITKIRLKT